MPKFRWETEFKETEIGEVPRGWEVSYIEKIANISTGGTPSRKKKKYWGGRIKWVKSQEVRNRFIWDTEETITEDALKNSNAKRIYPPNTVLVALYGATAGEISILKISATINQAIAALEGEKVDNKFLFYSMIGNKDRLKELAIGSAQQNLYLRDIKEFKIPYPPPDEQSRVATVLSWFDDLIENKKKQNEILEKTAMAIFKSWFVDFEPFKDGEFSYNDELDKEIPKEWKVAELKEIIEFNPKVKLKKGEIYPFIEMKQVSTNSMVCEYGFKKFSGSGVRFKGGDTLLARITPSLENGKTAIVWFLNRNQAGFGTTEFIVMRPKWEFLREFIYLLARDGDFREHAISSMGGTSGRQRVEKEALETYKISVPPQPILEKFHALVEPLFSKIIINQKEIMVLKKVRDALLPLLIFGRLRIEEV